MPTLRTVKDVMSAQLVTASRTTPFKELVEQLTGHHISAVPVLDGWGQVIGIVSEADLLPREAFRDRRPSRHELLLHLDEIERGGGATAEDLMTSPAVVVSQHATLSQAARLMARHHVRRLPVVDANGMPVGIVSRGDLLKVFLIRDEELADLVVAELGQTLHSTDVGTLRIKVNEGVVTVSGRLADSRLLHTLARVIGGVEGVVDVDLRLDREQPLSSTHPTTRAPR